MNAPTLHADKRRRLDRGRRALRPLVGALMLSLSLSSCSLASRSADLESRIAAARTPREHSAIAKMYLEKANESEAAALHHAALAVRYQDSASRRPGFDAYLPLHRNAIAHFRVAAKHCEALADNLRRVAGEFRELARLHEQLATILPADTEENSQ